MSYGVTPDDIAARWRPLEAAAGDINEVSLAALLITDAEDFLDVQFPDLASSWQPGTRLSRVTTATISSMVVRIMRNPDALKQQSVEDVQQSFAGPEYDGRMYLTSDEFALMGTALAEVAEVVTATGAFSFNPTLNRRSSSWPVRVLRPR